MQLSELREYAGRRGWQIVEEFTDQGVSGCKESRPALNRLMSNDIESRVPDTGKLRFIEVKGRVADATTVTVTRNEILTALNKPEDFILAVGQIENGQGKLLYIRQPFQLEPEFSVESVNYKLQELLNRGEEPA